MLLRGSTLRADIVHALGRFIFKCQWDRGQGWVGSRLRPRLRLPEARFSRKCWLPGRLRLPSIQKLLDSASASAFLNAVFDGFGFGFGFVILEAGIAYRIALCQNRRFISLPGGIRTHDPFVTDKAILPTSVPVEQCLSRPNGTSRSGAMKEFMKSLGTCL